MARRPPHDALDAAKEDYLTQWGALGSAWGVNRTMSRIHALLMISPDPLNTDEIMEELGISRGNAHGNLKELLAWGLVHSVQPKGERKEHFEAEKVVWNVVQRIATQRRRREVEPAIQVLERRLEQTKGLRDSEARAFRRQLKELHRFARLGERAMRRVEKREMGKVLPWLLDFLG